MGKPKTILHICSHCGGFIFSDWVYIRDPDDEEPKFYHRQCWEDIRRENSPPEKRVPGG